MASKEYFFEKMFSKGDEAKYLYKNYDFNQLSDEEKKFLSRLTIFSKYKNVLRKFLTKKDVGLLNKSTYIQLNASHLNYEEFVCAERCLEYQQEMMSQALWWFITSTAIISFGVVAWKPQGSAIIKDITRLSLISFIAHFSYFMYYRQFTYKPEIERIYETLSVRLNSVEDLKYGNYAEDSKENYFRVDRI